MRLIRDISQLEQLQQGSVATIGNFDGLHLGHQLIFDQLARHAETLALPKVVISFEPLPIEFFSAHQAQRVYPFRDKVRYLSQLGIDYFLCLRFDDKLANMPPDQFIHELLLRMANVRHLVVGDDFCFGKKRQGNYQLLKETGKQHNMEVSNSLTHSDDTGRISSTRIRQHLNAGELKAANALLGRKYSLSGRVRHGDKMGRTIGFPTMNLRIQDNIAAANGVYAVRVNGLKGETLQGVANLGNRPTVGGVETRLEVYLFDFNEFVYGEHIEVELVSFIRPEIRFDNFEALTTQIGKDAIEAKNQFS
ncbi:bifunctional riboflavin kinase/FAD synthetase [Leucothrix pacifica]|uniref:Riboflavin biosynthesis protein n=1 Tax=Leucothrix pacifica TaxID=1247513 RepID=A0A317CDL9_9GAMM|nr:bifunctional riboflavin kinase/FAD synthetase [Leucothrix pacifica]PWQ96626.1 bifunctional riboflavin kinase/FAD synthetase [Leucothrix pacifica]